MQEFTRTIKNLAHDVDRRLIAAAPKELTPEQSAVARYIEANAGAEGMPQTQIERYFRIRRSTASGLLQALERKGFVDRRPDKTDGRIKRLFPTEKLHRVRDDFRARAEEVERAMICGFDETELDTLRTLLNRVKSNLER